VTPAKDGPVLCFVGTTRAYGSLSASSSQGSRAHVSRPCLLLINKASRSGRAAGDRARGALVDAGFVVEAPMLAEATDAAAAIRAADGIDLVVVGGGDGTISATAPALLETDKTLGILPLGTANDLAGTLKIPKTIAGAVDVLVNGVACAIDMGFVNGRPFFNAVTLGLGADVVREHNGPLKQRLGIFNYPRVVLKTMRERRYFKARIIVDGQTRKARLLHIGVANGRYHGGGLPAHADATIDDGILHLYAIRRATLWRYLKTLPALVAGHDGGDDLLRAAGRTIDIITDEPMPATADGEPLGSTPLNLACEPAALKVMMPAPPRLVGGG